MIAALRARAVAAALAVYSVLSIVMTWPLVLHLGDGLLATDSSALNDTYFCIWILGWQAHQLVTDPLHLFETNIFYPFPDTLAFTETIFPGVLAYLPLQALTGNPVLSYNLLLLACLPLNAAAMALYALDWLETGEERSSADRVLAAALVGLVFAFCTYKIGELRHIQLQLAMFLPLSLWALGRFLRRPTLGWAMLTGLLFAMNALTALYHAVFLSMAFALQVLVDGFLRRWSYSREHLVRGAAAALLAAVVLLPFALPYLRLDKDFLDTAARDPKLFSARPASYLATPGTQWLYGKLTRPFYLASRGQPMFPGLVALALAAIGITNLRRRGSQAWIFPLALGVAAFVLSFGPMLVLDRKPVPASSIPLPYYWASIVVPPLANIAAPARFGVLVMIAISLLAAAGATRVFERAERRRHLAGALLALAILAETIAVPLRWVPVDTGEAVSPAYRFLDAQPHGEPLVELPMGKPTFGGQAANAVYAYNSLYHFQHLVNGYGTFIPKEYYALVNDVQAFPQPAAVERLRQWGVVWLVVHADRYKTTPPDRLRAAIAARTELEPIREFGSIWLYRMRR